MRRGIEVSTKLLQAGHAVFCVWLDFQFGLMWDIPLKTYQANSMEWLKVSDAILLVPGWEKSKGVAAEMEEARKLDIPVFESLEDLKTWEKEFMHGL
jgi:hypothetical protein